MAKRLIDTVLSVVDVRRFPWLSRTGQHRDPDPVERDSASHVLLFSRYIANHPQEAAMMRSLPLPTHPRVMMLLIGPVIGVASGLVLGLFAVIAAKVVPARTKAALGQG